MSVPGPIESLLDRWQRRFLAGGPAVDFLTPPGEAALVPPESVSWRVFKNPATVFIGGVAAVLLEFAEPKVRAGVWDHSDFRSDPAGRLRRTGLAAMMTVYGARSRTQSMIEGVRRAHERVAGKTPGGEAYRADDPDLLDWVYATASFGFIEAYDRYAAPIDPAEKDAFFAEGAPAARLYGAPGAPRTLAEFHALFASRAPRFEASPIVFEFMKLVSGAKALPAPLRPLQALFVRAAVDITPDEARAALGLGARRGLRPGERFLIRRIASAADRLILPSSPAVEACRRLGLPSHYLYQ